MGKVLTAKLPWMASNAAVDLDLLVNGEEPPLEAVKVLGEWLRQALGMPVEGQPARGFRSDMETEAILGQAFTRVGADPTTILGELFHRTEVVTGQLLSADTDTDRNVLEWLRDFCLALSQSAAAFRQTSLRLSEGIG
jgi:hypothetical protein